MALPSVFSARAGFPAGLEVCFGCGVLVLGAQTMCEALKPRRLPLQVLLVAEQGAECAKLLARLGELSYKGAGRLSAGIGRALATLRALLRAPRPSCLKLASRGAVTPFSSADEAAVYLTSPAGQAIEVLLAEVCGPCFSCARAGVHLQCAVPAVYSGAALRAEVCFAMTALRRASSQCNLP